MINRETAIYISIAESPGNFGVQFHNEGFKRLGINAIYIPRKVPPNNLEAVITGIRALNIQGCSVSMPHKQKVIEFLDNIHPSAEQVYAINTIINTNGFLTGYNTDINGAQMALQTVGNLSKKEVILLGAGGAAHAVAHAVHSLGGRLTIANRNPDKGEELANKYNARFFPWEEKQHMKGDILINTTSLGMRKEDPLPIDSRTIARFETIMDIVVRDIDTALVQIGRRQGKRIIPGKIMTTYQASAQFKLYTGQDFPEDLLRGYLE